MRVLVTIFEQLVPISDGGTPRISSVIDILVKRGHEVSVAASFAADATGALQILGCNKVFPLNNVSRLDKNKMKKYLFFHPVNIYKVVRETMKLKPDLIIAHNSIVGLATILAKKNCEKPIVVSDLPALREVIEPWQTGLFYKPSDPKDLAEKTSALLEDRQLSRKMAAAGRKLVEEEYNWEKLATQFVNICERML